ncbi:MAG: ATP-binding protein [Anaerolineae bacterium]|nr:ATP-binding protein [Anaerolineae bacterium]
MVKWATVKAFLDIPVTDPDDARRRRLLNILLLYTVILTALTTLASFGLAHIGLGNPPQNPYLALLSTPIVLVGAALLYLLNRYVSGYLASILFLVLVLVSAFTDPESATSGKLLLVFPIPIVMASFLIRPAASFAMAALVSLAVSWVKVNIVDTGIDVSLIPTFFVIALVTWIAARTLESALRDLRTLNRELDQRVIERTRELARALAREQAEASKNQAILASIADGVIVFDNAGVAIAVNPAMRRLLGKSHDQIIGSSIGELMGADVSQEDQEIIHHLLNESALKHPASLKLVWGDKTLLASFASLLDAYGRRTGTVSVFHDFTREAELERLKRSFVSRVSHELRTPLNAIIGYADMLKEAVYGPLSEAQAKAVDRIGVNGRQLLNLVNDLLDQAQIEAGTLRLKIELFSPAELVRHVLEVMEVLATTKGLSISASIADDVPSRMLGDPQRLQQILINLVGNAIKFTDQGSVGIRVYLPGPGQWALEVSDTGCGIPREAQSYIFEPFRQVDGSPTRKYSGSGLGLSIVKQLTTMMGGEVLVESEVGRGSTFTVVLPILPAGLYAQEKADE